MTAKSNRARTGSASANSVNAWPRSEQSSIVRLLRFTGVRVPLVRRDGPLRTGRGPYYKVPGYGRIPATLSERSVIAPTTARVMTASTTPYSAIVCPSSRRRNESAATCTKVKSFSIWVTPPFFSTRCARDGVRAGHGDRGMKMLEPCSETAVDLAGDAFGHASENLRFVWRGRAASLAQLTPTSVWRGLTAHPSEG